MNKIVVSFLTTLIVITMLSGCVDEGMDLPTVQPSDHKKILILPEQPNIEGSPQVPSKINMTLPSKFTDISNGSSTGIINGSSSYGPDSGSNQDMVGLKIKYQNDLDGIINKQAEFWNYFETYKIHDFQTEKDYNYWLEGLKQRSDDYENYCIETIYLGRNYSAKLNLDTAEYKIIKYNEDVLNNNTVILKQVFEDCDKASYRWFNEETGAENYRNNLDNVTNKMRDLRSYYDTNTMYDFTTADGYKLWLDGLTERTNAYEEATSGAIAAGREYSKYLKNDSYNQKVISLNEKILSDDMDIFRQSNDKCCNIYLQYRDQEISSQQAMEQLKEVIDMMPTAVSAGTMIAGALAGA